MNIKEEMTQSINAVMAIRDKNIIGQAPSSSSDVLTARERRQCRIRID